MVYYKYVMVEYKPSYNRVYPTINSISHFSIKNIILAITHKCSVVSSVSSFVDREPQKEEKRRRGSTHTQHTEKGDEKNPSYSNYYLYNTIY